MTATASDTNSKTTPDMAAAIRRFPLVAWARPACPTLPERVADIAAQAKALRDSPTDRETAESAAALLNLAALIASDCRDSALAEDLCHRHLDIYLKHDKPVAYTDAPLLLGPATNLARLRMRAADGDTALTILVNLLRGVRRRADVTVDGRILPLSTLHGEAADQQQLVMFAWLQLLTDGTKALALAGRWTDAARLVDAYNGIGLHLFEGRQVVIIDRLLDCGLAAARGVLADVELTEPWEHEVAACLTLLLADRSDVRGAVGRLASMFDAAGGRPDRPHYRARLGVTTAVLVAPHDQDLADSVLHRTAAEILEAPDGYAARELLQHAELNRILDQDQAAALRQCVDASGLTGGRLTGRVLAALMDSTASALRVLDQAYRDTTESTTSAR